jgi:hypothetical protein
MMGRQRRDQGRLFYEFRLEDRIPENHLLRRMNVFVAVALGDLHKELEPHYSDFGRPSIDPELMIRMLIVGYCYGIRSERKLCQEVELHLAYRWFCKLDLEDTGAARPGARRIEGRVHGGQHDRVLAHAEIVVGAPHGNRPRAALCEVRCGGKVAAVAADVCEYPVAPFVLQSLQCPRKHLGVIHERTSRIAELIRNQ